ncbi:MAG: carbohydrate ABC transporter permease [Deinococcales bacterium]|jgi:multiple sugar transport system permease protein
MRPATHGPSSGRRAASRPGLLGTLLATAVGALACALSVGGWSLTATVVGGLDTTTHLGTALALGAVMGVVLAHWRGERDTRAVAALAAGAGSAALWLAASRGLPLGGTRIEPVWGVAAAVVAMLFAAHLTRYGLRGIALKRPTRNELEALLLRIVRAVGFTFFGVVVAFPFYFMVVSSLKSRAEMLQRPTFLGINLHQSLGKLFVGYREVLTTFHFGRFIFNSTVVAVVTVAVTLVLSILGAYAVTRLRFRGRELLSRSILLIYMFPAIVLVIPLYSVFTQLGLRDTLPGLLIVYPATTLPVALYMLRSYFQTLPSDLEEAGLIDGCSRLGVIARITLPLSLPALASVGLYVFMIAWNEFLFAFMFLDSPAIFTLSRGMVSLNSQEVPRQFLMAGAVIVTVPIMVLFFWFERYLIAGLTAGGVKG